MIKVKKGGIKGNTMIKIKKGGKKELYDKGEERREKINL